MVFSMKSEYDYFIKDLLARKTKPYHMSNAALAKQFYERFKLDYPSASLHCYDISQYICMNDRARRNLIKQLQSQQQRQEEALQQTMNLIAEVESGIQAHDEPEPEEPDEPKEPEQKHCISNVQEPPKPRYVKVECPVQEPPKPRYVKVECPVQEPPKPRYITVKVTTLQPEPEETTIPRQHLRTIGNTICPSDTPLNR